LTGKIFIFSRATFFENSRQYSTICSKHSKIITISSNTFFKIEKSDLLFLVR